jgi:hypothetical protein
VKQKKHQTKIITSDLSLESQYHHDYSFAFWSQHAASTLLSFDLLLTHHQTRNKMEKERQNTHNEEGVVIHHQHLCPYLDERALLLVGRGYHQDKRRKKAETNY